MKGQFDFLRMFASPPRPASRYTTPMLDDLARALRQSHLQDLPRKSVYQPEPGFDELDPSQQEYYRRMVRAVLVAQRELLPRLLGMATAAFLDEESIEVILGLMLDKMGDSTPSRHPA